MRYAVFITMYKKNAGKICVKSIVRADSLDNAIRTALTQPEIAEATLDGYWFDWKEAIKITE